MAWLIDCACRPQTTITANGAWVNAAAIGWMPMVDAAVSDRLGADNNPVVFTITLEAPQSLNYAGLYGNFEQETVWRLEVLGPDGAVAADSRVAGADRTVMPGLFAWEQMNFGDPNFWRGDLPRDVWLAGRPAIHHLFPVLTVAALRWTLVGPAFLPNGAAADRYRIGYAPIGVGLEIHRGVGSTDTDDPRAETTAVTGGGRAIDPGTPEQTNVIDLTLLDRATRDRLAVVTRGAGNDLPLVYLPGDDAVENFMWGGVRRVVGPTGHRWPRTLWTDATLTLAEWTE